MKICKEHQTFEAIE